MIPLRNNPLLQYLSMKGTSLIKNYCGKGLIFFMNNNRKQQTYPELKIAAWITLCIFLSVAILIAKGLDVGSPSAAGHTKSQSGGQASYKALNTSHFTNPATKNSTDLVLWAQMAYDEGWGYVYGTFGLPLTETTLDNKVRQYPNEVGENEQLIREHWLGRRTVDCMGLIKSYMWYDPEDNNITYNAGGMPDIGCDTLFEQATVRGTIDTIPEVKGLAVYAKGHIGIYIGDGYAIDAQSTTEGVTKTKINTRKWTHWCKIPYVDYGD